MGLIGLGSTGQAVAERLAVFGSNVLYAARHRCDDAEARLGVRYAPLPDLLAACDLVSLHVPLTPETHHLIGEAELAQMPAGALLVNTSRGQVVDEAALRSAIERGHLGGAGIDVLDDELSDVNPFAAFPQVLVTPHIAGMSQKSLPRAMQLAAANIGRFLRGEQLEDPVPGTSLATQLPGLLAVADTGWDTESFNALRTGKATVLLLASREMRPVLQYAGQALLAELAAGSAVAEPYTRRCAQDLQERFWEGDTQLALELRHALGEQFSAGEHGIPAWPLETIEVDLADLADHLDGDPSRGRGVVDLHTGLVWPPGITDCDPPPELDKDSDDYDEDRWLFFSPESGEGYRDMLRFTDHVDDEQLRQRLLEAVDGRGAFRRFKDVVHSRPDDVQTRWHIYSQERALGRARAWLAPHGYRPTPDW